MKLGGKGGALTKSGLVFESRMSLPNAFKRLSGYRVDGNRLLHHDSPVAEFYRKNSFYSGFLEPRGVDWRKRISRQLFPDDALFVLRSKTLFVIEMKFQQVEGSVDEKLQTCHFKKRQYDKLLEGTGATARYVYVLNEWFEDARYNDVKRYIEEVGCHYFLGALPLEFLGLPGERGGA